MTFNADFSAIFVMSKSRFNQNRKKQSPWLTQTEGFYYTPKKVLSHHNETIHLPYQRHHARLKHKNEYSVKLIKSCKSPPPLDYPKSTYYYPASYTDPKKTVSSPLSQADRCPARQKNSHHRSSAAPKITRTISRARKTEKYYEKLFLKLLTFAKQGDIIY